MLNDGESTIKSPLETCVEALFCKLGGGDCINLQLGMVHTTYFGGHKDSLRVGFTALRNSNGLNINSDASMCLSIFSGIPSIFLRLTT